MPAELDAGRFEDWEARLMDLVAGRAGTTFAWGTADCFTWAADGVQATTGFDPMALWRGTYRSRSAALALLREHGGIERCWTAALGQPAAPVWARRGDVCLVPQPGMPLVAICLGDRLAAQAEIGLAWLPTDAATACWRVG